MPKAAKFWIPAAILVALRMIPATSLYADSFQDAQDRGIGYYQSGNYNAAIASFTEASNSPDKNVAMAACQNVGLCYNVNGDQDQAISWFERALGYDQKYLPALEGLALSCFGDKKTYEKGYQYARRAENLYSAEPGVYYNLSCYFGYKGDAVSALRYIDAALFYGFYDLDFLAADADLAVVNNSEPYKSFRKNFASIRNVLSLRSEAEKENENGNYLKAQQLYLQAVDSCRTALGTDGLFESGLLSSMASAFYYLGKNGPALDARKQALAIQQKRQGRLHPNTAYCNINVGNAFYCLAQYDDALTSYLEALSIQIQTLGEKSSELRYTHNYIAEAYKAKGDYLQAAAAFERALSVQVAVLGSGHQDVAGTYTSLGNVCLSLGEFERADRYYNQALSIQLKIFGANDMETIATYEYLGDLFYAQSEFDKALVRYNQDLEAIKKITGEYSTQAAQCYQRLGAAHYSLGQYEKSAAYYEQARLIWEKAMGGDYPEVARCFLGLGAVYYTRGLYDDAIDVYSKALEIQRASYGGDTIDVAKNYLGLGLSFFSKGEFSKAITYYEMAVVIQKKLTGELGADLSRSYMNLSAAYSAMKDTGNAIAYINKCISIQEKIFGPQHVDVSVTLKMAGGIYYDMGDFQTAIAFYQKALDIQERVFGAYHQQVAETKNNLGTAYFNEGLYDKAIKLYQEASGIKEKVFGKENAFLGLDYLNMGLAYYKKGDTAKAQEFMQKAQVASQKSPDRQLVVDIAENLGELYYGLKKYSEAKKAIQGGIDLVEKARKDIGSAKTEIMGRNIGLYYLSIKASAALKNMDEVFAGAESMKARGFLDRLSLAGALGVKGVSDKDRKRLMELGEQIERLARWQWDEINKPADLQDKKTLLSVIDKLKAFETEFEKLDNSLMAIPQYRELRQPRIVKLKDAQKTLGPDQAFIDYIISAEGSLTYAWCLVIKRDSVALVELDPSFDYTKAVFDLRDAIISGSKSRNALSGQLYTALIKPLESNLAGVKQLIIVPVGSLALMPFDVLRKDGNSPYLCQTYQISLAPSVSVLTMTDGRPYGKRTGEWLGVGGVIYDDGTGSKKDDGRGISKSDAATDRTKAYYAAMGQKAYFEARGLLWNDLPGTKYEVENIAQKAFGGKGVQVLLGEQASEMTVKKLSESGELARQRIVHFACHAFFDGDYPQYSALVLSEAGGITDGLSQETGYLTVEDVALLRFNADLVALSACETGQGSGFPGDGLVGFARSLLVAGANRAHLTLWPIADAATRDFMIRWYTLIKMDGMDFSKALAQVKREFIRSDSYSDPVYWSGFVLYGR
jgi:tetratricopeptide (TPR) repeat protein